MARPLDLESVSFLPYLTAEDAITLATKLEAVALPPKGKGAPKRPKLTPPINAALKDVVAARGALQKEASKVPVLPPLVKKADQAEDAAVGALHDVLRGWARAPSSVSGSDAARRVLAKMFAEGASFIHETVDREWAIVEGKLKSLDAETKAGIALVGATPLLQHLETVHATYGDAIGATTPRPQTGEPPQIRKRFDALRAAINDYVLKVAASVDKKKAATSARRDLLLAPLAAKVAAPSPRKAPAKAGKSAVAPAPTDGAAAAKA